MSSWESRPWHGPLAAGSPLCCPAPWDALRRQGARMLDPGCQVLGGGRHLGTKSRPRQRPEGAWGAGEAEVRAGSASLRLVSGL